MIKHLLWKLAICLGLKLTIAETCLFNNSFLEYKSVIWALDFLIPKSPKSVGLSRIISIIKYDRSIEAIEFKNDDILNFEKIQINESAMDIISSMLDTDDE